jgi:uncharacterized protein YhbP (UPF0306 family)
MSRFTTQILINYKSYGVKSYYAFDYLQLALIRKAEENTQNSSDMYARVTKAAIYISTTNAEHKMSQYRHPLSRNVQNINMFWYSC